MCVVRGTSTIQEPPPCPHAVTGLTDQPGQRDLSRNSCAPGEGWDLQRGMGRVKHRTLIPCFPASTCRAAGILIASHISSDSDRCKSMGLGQGERQPSGYRYPPPPLARNGTRWEAPAAFLAPAQAYPESILGSFCKGASQSPGRGGKQAKTSSSGQGPGSCLLERGTGLGCLRGGCSCWVWPPCKLGDPGTPAAARR